MILVPRANVVAVAGMPVQFMSRQKTGLVFTVTVAPPPKPLPALKTTWSLAVGGQAPPDPPEDVDQLAALVVFQLPLPPTQYKVRLAEPPV